MVSNEKTTRPGRRRNAAAATTAVLCGVSLLLLIAIVLLPSLDGRFRLPQNWHLAIGSWLPAGDGQISASILLGTSFMLLLALTRWQLSRNAHLNSLSGCPHCSSQNLARIHRSRLLRRVSKLLYLRTGLFICRDCGWEGIRTIGYIPGPHAATAKNSSAGTNRPVGSLETAILFAAGDAPVTSREIEGAELTNRQAGQAHVGTIMGGAAAAFEPPADSTVVAPGWLETVGRVSDRSYLVALFYLVALTIAETMAVTVAPISGAIFHIVILFVLALHAAFTWNMPIHRFLLSLMLVPLIRIVSLSLPLTDFQLVYWFLITSIPLFGAAYFVMRELSFTLGEAIGFSWRGLPLQLLIGAGGILLGLMEYLILRPEPLINSFSWSQVWLPALILLFSTGFLEEFVFRFLMQQTAVERLGVFIGIIYVALLFAVLHIGYHSVLDFIFVFTVGWIFGELAFRTRSILGVTIAHGLTNICLFLVFPFIFTGPL